MAVSNTQITQEDVFAPIPYQAGGFVLPTPTIPQGVQYEAVDAVTGNQVNVDPDAVNLEPLDGLSEIVIRRRLLVFRNGYKIRYRDAAVTDERSGFNIDYINHRLTLAYDADDEDFEIYLFPS
jgi:hypothetical protein